MTEIKVVGVQQLEGRLTEYVRVLGYRALDAAHRIVEVAVSAEDAFLLVQYARVDGDFPVIEVPDNAWVHCLNPGDIQIIRTKEST